MITINSSDLNPQVLGCHLKESDQFLETYIKAIRTDIQELVTIKMKNARTTSNLMNEKPSNTCISNDETILSLNLQTKVRLW